VNTDNRLITDTSVSKELYLVHTQMGVPFADIKSIILAGFKSSFQPFHEKQAALRRVGVELDKYDDYGVLLTSQNGTSSERPSRRPRVSAEIAADAE
jgi:adenosine deaminase